MKITLISYDFWDYDRHIVDALSRKGVEAHHIKMGDYRHPNLGARLKNTFSKTFLGKNLKTQKRQEMILEKLEKIGKQDQILVINPESISQEFHEKIKNFTKIYKAYLYDAMARNPAEKVLPFFDEVFSFDKDDCKKFGFKELHNYNYLPEYQLEKNPEFDLMYIGSYDDRFPKLYNIAEKLESWQKKYRFYIIGKKSWKKKLEPNKNFVFGRKKIPHNELPEYYKKSFAIMDLVRDGQSGLSFRIFEAMALKKKVVTNNPAVKNYDFYNPKNILVLGEKELTKDFFESDYQELSKEIYRKYTVEYWVEKVFNL